MFRIVCTKHVQNLSVDDASFDGMLALACDIDVDETFDKFRTYSWDLSRCFCLQNEADTAEVDPASDYLAYLQAIDEADCTRWYAVVDANSNEPFDDEFTESIHPNWWSEVKGTH